MKKFVCLLSTLLLVTAVGCSNSDKSASEQNASAGEVKETVQTAEAAPNKGEEKTVSVKEDGASGMGNPVTKNNVTITLTHLSIAPAKGDRTQDNVQDDNGEYFAIGSDIVKAADYEQLVLTVKIENNTDKALTFSEMGWSATLPDGYKIKSVKGEGKLRDQVASKSTGEGKLTIIREKAVNADKINLTYQLMDYNDEWRKAMPDVLSGKLDEKGYKKKFNPQEMKFEVPLN